MNGVLVACFPKSGSSAISEAIAALPGFRRVHLVRDYERREQELDENCIGLQVQVNSQLPNSLFVAQHHVRISSATLRLCNKYNIKPLILTRNLPDVLCSLEDFVRDPANRTGSSAFFDDHYEAMDRNMRLCFFADMVLPWYLNFFMGWRTVSDFAERWFRYEEMAADKAAFASRLTAWLAKWGYNPSPEHVRSVLADSLSSPSEQTRFNKGVNGRGRELPSSVRDAIRAKINWYRHTLAPAEIAYLMDESPAAERQSEFKGHGLHINLGRSSVANETLS